MGVRIHANRISHTCCRYTRARLRRQTEPLDLLEPAGQLYGVVSVLRNLTIVVDNLVTRCAYPLTALLPIRSREARTTD
jgi:hypothetical protein